MQRNDLRAVAIAGALALVGIVVVAPMASSSSAHPAAAGGADTVASSVTTLPGTTLPGTAAPASTDGSSTPTDPTAAGATTTVAAEGGDVGDATDEQGCRLTERSLAAGSEGDNVICLQEALVKAGYMSSVTGSFDASTDAAVRKLQTDKDLFVDGVAGRETGLALGIWPDEASLVVHTPKPPAGAKDLMGYPLSSVASAGADAPPLPANSGEGRRLVYSRAGQRVWAVDAKGRVIRSWLVSGSKYGNELPGTHTVYSKSEVTTAWNGKAYLHKMVRWLKTERGNIGFHSIPIHVADGTVYQTEAELGQRLSGGCQRQAPLDAAFVWDFATIGTKVVVL